MRGGVDLKDIKVFLEWHIQTKPDRGYIERLSSRYKLWQQLLFAGVYFLADSSVSHTTPIQKRRSMMEEATALGTGWEANQGPIYGR